MKLYSNFRIERGIIIFSHCQTDHFIFAQGKFKFFSMIPQGKNIRCVGKLLIRAQIDEMYRATPAKTLLNICKGGFRCIRKLGLKAFWRVREERRGGEGRGRGGGFE
jgi:hypothetical protein